LPAHTNDAAWHERNKRRYERVLRDPARTIVEELRSRYIERLNPAVAGAKHQMSRLNKNDYGKGGYYDHYWFAFYDPAAGSKIRSVQLFLSLHGSERTWSYGLSMGNRCEEYVDRLSQLIAARRESVAHYLRTAPADTRVLVATADEEQNVDPATFAELLMSDHGTARTTTVKHVAIIRQYPLDALPSHSFMLVDDVGDFFTWVWPFFEAAMTGVWNASEGRDAEVEEEGEVDEEAPQTLYELSTLTALPESFLDDLEEALLAKQQAVLVGPPGTSKTYLARQFARYFVRQRIGRPQGTFDVLYMHASWSYEEFFQGVKATAQEGALKFDSRPGFFLDWVDGLARYSSKARHVLVLDEINRCDTAAVLGELLQLLEYRGTTVHLLCGRNFVFPRNLFIIGTMNSADRSIGRLDLALRRRFLWIDLHPQPTTLESWLSRAGNNPHGFQASSLVRCNQLLAEHGIPPEQQIGHALFMLQRMAEDDEASPNLDIPLSERQLRQIVKFSVLPYVRELLTMQFGQADTDLIGRISTVLLQCVDGQGVPSEQEATGVQPPA
jgi:MoxR-like ATPase